MLVQTYAFLKALLQVLVANVPPVSVAATATNANPTLTAAGSLAGVAVGAAISGTGIATGATVLALDDAAHTVTMSANATSTSTSSKTFTNPSTGAPFNAALKVGLFQNNYTPTPSTVLADLTAATFDGYALSAVVAWSAVGVDDVGNPLAIGDQKLFQMSGAVTPNTIYGYFVVDSAGTTLKWAEKFPNPKSMVQLGDQVAVVPTYGLANAA